MSAYVTIHDDDFPFTLKDFTIDLDDKSLQEALDEIVSTVEYIEDAKENPEEYGERLYGDEEPED